MCSEHFHNVCAYSPRITRVLREVSYLLPSAARQSKSTAPPVPIISDAANARTYSRLLETMQFVLDVMNCVVPSNNSSKRSTYDSEDHLFPGGEGWKSIIRVRLLHGTARRRIVESGGSKGYDQSKDGIPINQEDLAAVLVINTFSVSDR